MKINSKIALSSLIVFGVVVLMALSAGMMNNSGMTTMR